MDFDADEARSAQKLDQIKTYSDCKRYIAGSAKAKVKFVDDRIWCQKIPSPIPAIVSFSLPRGWVETNGPQGAIPGQHGHKYHPAGNEKISLRFYCAGLRASDDAAKLIGSLLGGKVAGAAPPLDDPELKYLISNHQTKVLKVISARVVDWNGRKVLECEYTASSSTEPAFADLPQTELKGWALIYDNNDSAANVPLPASIEFIAPENEFRTNLQTAMFAAKSILWNKDWPRKK